MKKQSPTDDEDTAFFRAAMKNVKSLKKTNKVLLKPPKPSRVKITPTKVMENSHELSDHITRIVSSDEKLFFSKPGLQNKVLRDFRQGQIPQTALLDLHGMTVSQARHAMNQFFNACIENGDRCVRIIHGKGKSPLAAPRLKNHVNSWLQQYPFVLAFCSAKPCDGGTGAVYVLLKRNR